MDGERRGKKGENCKRLRVEGVKCGWQRDERAEGNNGSKDRINEGEKRGRVREGEEDRSSATSPLNRGHTRSCLVSSVWSH